MTKPRPRALPWRSWLPLAAVTLGTSAQRGLAALLVVAMVAVANRQDGPDAAGMVGVIAALALVATALADWGTTTASLRDFAVAPPSKGEFGRVLGLKLALAVLPALALPLVAIPFAGSDAVLALAVAATALPLTAVSSAAASKLVTDRAGVALAAGAAAGFGAGALVLVLAAGHGDAPLWAILAPLPAARAAEAVVLLGACRFPAVLPSVEHRYGLAWLRGCWPIAVSWLLQVAYVRAEVLVPAIVLNGVARGEVAKGFQLYTAATLVQGAFAVATWPQITRAARRSAHEGTREAVRFGLLSVAIVAPFAVAFLAFPRPVLEGLYGSATGSLVTYTRITGVATIIVSANAFSYNLLLSRGQGRSAAALWGFGLVLSALLLLGGAALWGVAGVGVAVLVSEAVLGAAMLGLLARSPARAPYLTLPSLRLRPGPALKAVVLVVVVALLAGAAAAPLGEAGAFPSPRAGLLVLLGLPVVVLLVLRQLHYDLLAPASVFALAWTVALGTAQIPLLPSFSWDGDTWLLLTVPPAMLTAGAALVTGGTAIRRQSLAESLGKRPAIPGILVAVLALAGALGWVRYFLSIGAVPLFSSAIDQLRFSTFDATTLVLTRAGFVAAVFGVVGVAASPRLRTKLWFAGWVGLSALFMILSGGRLNAIAALGAGFLAVILAVGVSRKTLLGVVGAGVVVVAGSSFLFFARIDQQPANPFKNYLDDHLEESRPGWLRWTIPVQFAEAASMNTLSDLVQSDAFDSTPGEGWFSLKALDRFVKAKDPEEPARRRARFSQVTSTYVGPLYGDFGLVGAIFLSFLGGLAYGLLYRLAVIRRSLTLMVLYAYAAFWLVFASYLNYWTVHGLWLADIPLFVFVGLVAARARAGPQRAPGFVAEPAVAVSGGAP